MSDCIFCSIRDGESPGDVVYEDEQVLALRDINPQAPVHLLVIPRRHVRDLDDADAGDGALLGHLQMVIRQLAAREGVAGDGYRVVVNNGSRANQTVPHLHYHLLGGRDFTWPPG